MNFLAAKTSKPQIDAMGKFDEFAGNLRPGQAYRRADLARWSTSVDRHLKQAVDAGLLTKAAGGL
jgi:hypothetical protein